MLFFTLFELFLFFLFWFAKQNVFLCEIVLYSVENYRFYFNGLKSRGARVAFLIWSQSLCSGFKNEKICYKFGTSEYVLKEFSSFCVCVFFFSFCPKGQLKAVLIAQTHRQQVILYMPSVVPSFVYLLLNCLRRVLVCCICVLNLRFFLGSNCEKMKREMRELFYSFLAVRHKNIHVPIPLVLDVQYHPGFLLLCKWATLSRNGKGFLVNMPPFWVILQSRPL